MAILGQVNDDIRLSCWATFLRNMNEAAQTDDMEACDGRKIKEIWPDMEVMRPRRSE